MLPLAKYVDPDDRNKQALVLARGDMEGFRALFESCYAPLCAYAAGFVQARDIAEEIVQAVFVRLWYRCERGDVTGNVKSYLYTAVRNRALNAKRHERVVHRLHAIAANAIAIGRSIPGASQAPMPVEAEIEHGETVEQVQLLVRTLPAGMREVLTLRWDHGMSYREIAAVLGIREKSAKQQHSRAVAALRQRLNVVRSDE